MRTLVIGDIHGGLRALVQLIEKAKLAVEDRLIFLGDYVDGWSESKQLIDFLIALDKSRDCIFIKGNHDTWCEEWLGTNVINTTWAFHGGISTMQSYKGIDDQQRREHLNFFQAMRNYYVDENNSLFIHAGFSSMHGPEKENYTSNFSWDRTLWELAVAMDKRLKKDSRSYPKRLKLFNEIYIGHTPTLNYDVAEPMNAVNVWNIDTGAGFNGKLTLLDTGTKNFWQSEIVQDLYPGERGRNRD